MFGPAFINRLAAAAIAAAALLIAIPAGAGDGVPIPQPAKGKGDKCVNDTSFMRRYHMKMLKHQRDDTMHQGIRTEQYSLKGCIDCHAVAGPDTKPVTFESADHFCRTCHDYAAVSIDCFQCHASTPRTEGQADAGGHADIAALKDYVRGLEQ